MLELEGKILNVKRKELICRLDDVGARLVYDGTLYTTYYDYPHHPFGRDRRIRIRYRVPKEGEPSVEVDAKLRLSKEVLKASEEFKLPPFFGPDAYEKARMFFHALGLVQINEVRKERLTYALEDSFIDIDKIRGKYNGVKIPPFIEIESPTTARFEEVTKQLGFSMDDVLPWSLTDLLNHYGK